MRRARAAIAGAIARARRAAGTDRSRFALHPLQIERNERRRQQRRAARGRRRAAAARRPRSGRARARAARASAARRPPASPRCGEVALGVDGAPADRRAGIAGRAALAGQGAHDAQSSPSARPARAAPSSWRAASSASMNARRASAWARRTHGRDSNPRAPRGLHRLVIEIEDMGLEQARRSPRARWRMAVDRVDERVGDRMRARAARSPGGRLRQRVRTTSADAFRRAAAAMILARTPAISSAKAPIAWMMRARRRRREEAGEPEVDDPARAAAPRNRA